MGSDDTIRWTNDVFTRRDNRRRQTSSFHSSGSLDVTLHLFISSLNAGSKGGWGVARIWSWKYQVTLNIEPSCHTKCIWIMGCWVNKHLHELVHLAYISVIYVFVDRKVKLIFGLLNMSSLLWFHTSQFMSIYTFIDTGGSGIKLYFGISFSLWKLQ